MGDVSIIKLGVEIVTCVDGVLGLLETLISPLVSVSIVVFRSRNGNFIIDGGGVISKSVPVSRVKRLKKVEVRKFESSRNLENSSPYLEDVSKMY